MNLDDDDFELFGLPRRFALDRDALDARWRDAAGARCIPTASPPAAPAAQRVAMQWAVRVNEAYQRLKDPLQRAAYLCELHGVADRRRDQHRDAGRVPDAADGVARSARRGARRDGRCDALRRRDRGRGSRRALDASSARLLDDAATTAAAAARRCRALMFLERFADDIERRLDALETRAHGTAADLRARRSRPTRTSAASRSASTSAPPTRWSPRCAAASPSACPTRDGRALLPSVVRYLADGAAPDRLRRAGARRPTTRRTPSSRSSASWAAAWPTSPTREQAAVPTSSTRPAWCSCRRAPA